MANYDDFSVCYDRFTEDVDYSARTERLLELFNKYDQKPTLMLDLACGTGSFSYSFAENGIEVIGVDCSEGMLAAALSKQGHGSHNPLFLNQSAQELELFGTVDGAISMLDSLNHITDYNDFCKALSRVSLFLEKDRLFIFDLNTEYKHKEVLGDNTFVREDEDVFCVWQNEYQGDGVVDIYLDFFVSSPNGQYDRFCENFSEKAYSKNEIENALEKAGLELVDMFDDLSNDKPGDTTERITYIVRKK